MATNGSDSLRAFYTDVYRPLRLRGKNSSTTWQYVLQIDHFGRFLGHEPTFSDLSDDSVSAFLGWLVENGRAAETANKARSHILALWRLAARKGMVATYPDVPPERAPRRIPRAWTRDELVTLFAAIDATRGTIAGIPSCLWWHALHQVLWWTGERIGAVMQLEWKHLDEHTCWLTVPAEIRKRKTGDRIFQLPTEAVERILRIRVDPNGRMFPWPYAGNYLWGRYKGLLRKAGLTTDRKSMFHKMRRSTASYFEAAGGNATNLLDHSQRSVTLLYLDPTIVRPEQPKDRLFRPDDPQPPPIS